MPIDKILIFSLVVVLLSACYENTEECIDFLAVNYDVTADEMCDDECCVYPDLSISLSQIEGDDDFRLGDTIVNNLGQEVRLLDLVYLLSDVSLTIDGEELYIPDSTFIIKDNGDTIQVPENFVRMSRAKAVYVIGEMRDTGYVSAINFNVGLPSYMDGSAFLSSPINDLTTDPDSLKSEDLLYTTQRLQIWKGEEFTDSIIYDVAASLGPLRVSIPLDTTYAAGAAKLVSLSVDYERWLQDIDFDTANNVDDIADQLRENLAESFKANQ